MWHKSRNCFNTEEEYQEYLNEWERDNHDLLYEIDMGWRDSDGYAKTAFI